MSNEFREYDVVHFSGCNISSILPVYFAYKNGCRHIITHSHSSSNISGIHNKILHYINRRFLPVFSNEYLACSNDASKWFYGGLDVITKVHILKNGIDLDKFFFKKEVRLSSRSIMGLTDRFVITNISRFEEVKNHDFILEVFAKLLTKRKNAILLLVGEGSLKNKSKEKAVRLGIIDNCLFLGQRSDINELLNASDAIIFPSFFEGVPLSLIESQACGLPVFASNNVSSEVNITGQVYFNSLNESAEAWASWIIKRTSNLNRPNTHSILMEKGYSIKDTVSSIESIYKKHINC